VALRATSDGGLARDVACRPAVTVTPPPIPHRVPSAPQP
jgi:hypothetical protein